MEKTATARKGRDLWAVGTALWLLGCTTPADGGLEPGAPDRTSSAESAGDASTTEPAAHASASASEADASANNLAECNNGIIEGQEDCDCGPDRTCSEAELGSKRCEDVSDILVPGALTGGVLNCNLASCRFDTSQCVYCGDGELNGNETCELDQPIMTSCAELQAGAAGDLTCSESCQIDASACTQCGYEFSFDGPWCQAGWTTRRTNDAASPSSWACGTTGSVTDGPQPGIRGVWGTNLSGNYASNESASVRSGPLDLSNCGTSSVTMRVRHWFLFEGGVRNSDGGVVQITNSDPAQPLDGWVTLVPTASGVSYYPLRTLDASFLPVDGRTGFSGNDTDNRGMWVESVFDITDFVGPRVYVRFVAGADDSNERPGWYIDSVRIFALPS